MGNARVVIVSIGDDEVVKEEVFRKMRWSVRSCNLHLPFALEMIPVPTCRDDPVVQAYMRGEVEVVCKVFVILLQVVPGGE